MATSLELLANVGTLKPPGLHEERNSRILFRRPSIRIVLLKPIGPLDRKVVETALRNCILKKTSRSWRRLPWCPSW
eukprot:6844154-Lingulodinium_polyedra.AAC.1